MHKLHLDERLRDVRIRQADEEIAMLESNGASTGRLDEARARRRMADMSNIGYETALRRLEASAP